VCRWFIERRGARSSGEILHRLLGFDEGGWLGAQQVVVKPAPVKRQSVALGNNTIRNENYDSLKLDYDGTSPGIIESVKTVTMTITLGDKSSGVRMLVRPIRDPDKKR
jgi:hypothetical protein